MITENQQFFLDIIKLVPFEKSVLLLQAPYEEILPVIEKIRYRNDGIHDYIKLNAANREILLFEIIHNSIDEYIQSLDILVDGKKIFEGYDGMEYGLISKDVQLSPEFKEKYIDGNMCGVSREW